MEIAGLNQQAFLREYGLAEDALDTAEITWDQICDIVGDYNRIKPGLESVGRYIVDALLKCPKVHSIKYRLKEDAHLAEKILRKRLSDPAREFTVGSYRNQITDLVGIRALHLFKEDWTAVHDYIRSTWELVEKPTAYVRTGDSEKILSYYRQKDCEVQEHRFGYRSVHYVIESRPDREVYTIEIQARTVFEEGWGEIDHVISYPYDQENELLVRLSSILNRLAANADELGSYMRYLKAKTDVTEQQYSETLSEKNRLIADLQEKVSRLEIDSRQKEELTSGLAALGRNRDDQARLEEEYPWLEHFMESSLFKGITDRVNKIVSSPEFDDLEITESDVQLLMNAQRDLVRLIDNPEEVERVMKRHPLRNAILQLNSPQAEAFTNADDDKNEKIP